MAAHEAGDSPGGECVAPSCWPDTHYCPLSTNLNWKNNKKHPLFICFDHITVTALTEDGDTKDNYTSVRLE